MEGAATGVETVPMAKPSAVPQENNAVADAIAPTIESNSSEAQPHGSDLENSLTGTRVDMGLGKRAEDRTGDAIISTQKQNQLDNEWRVTLSVENVKREEPEHPYLEACRLLEVTPSNKFLKSIKSEVVNLKHTRIGPKGARALAIAFLHNADVRHLDLTGAGVDIEGGSALGEMLARSRTLSSLILADNNIAEGIKAIADGMTINKYLNTLSLRGNKLADAEAVAVAEMLQTNRQLSILDLSHNLITDFGICAIADALTSNDSLKELNLAWNRLRPRGVQMLMNGIKENASVCWLSIAWNGISDFAAISVSNTIAKSNFLIHLDLSHCRITETGIGTIAKGVEINRQLQELILDNNNFADLGALTIVKASVQCETLLKLSLRAIKFSAETKAKIAAAMEGNSQLKLHV